MRGSHLNDQHTHGDGSQQVLVVVQPLLHLLVAALKPQTTAVHLDTDSTGTLLAFNKVHGNKKLKCLDSIILQNYKDLTTKS